MGCSRGGRGGRGCSRNRNVRGGVRSRGRKGLGRGELFQWKEGIAGEGAPVPEEGKEWLCGCGGGEGAILAMNI